MDEKFRRETERLARSWRRHDRKTLREYLVRDVEDPRINLQSILTRHYLLGRLFGRRFSDLKKREIQFAAVMNWLIRQVKRFHRSEQLQVILYSLEEAEMISPDVEIPAFVREAFGSLPSEAAGRLIPDYISEVLTWSPVESLAGGVADYILSTFENIWRDVLADAAARTISVVEPACGSANDYRFLDAFGIGRFLDYYGFDLCEKNIANARIMFPQVRWAVGNVLEISSPDKAFAYGMVHDVFEHLSVPAMEAALAEIFRVTRRGLTLGFFNLYEGDRHVVRPVGDYHWNTLSRRRLQERMGRSARSVRWIHHDGFFARRFRWRGIHNQGAYACMVAL